MPTYAVGDIQGCFTPFQKLLEKIHFDPNQDHLWFTGDIVNRGPESLETLRFIKNLGTRQKMVLGNHDLHLLAVAKGAHAGSKEDTLGDILHAHDREELLNWLIQQPLLHHDAALGFTLVHAGLAPSWDLSTACTLAKEVETVLQSEKALLFFHHMYGNQPDAWHPNLQGWDRLRCITNYFTRVRFCDPDGRLELTKKGNVTDTTDEKLVPWFKVPHRQNKNLKIIFGHWAALRGHTGIANVFALDTGCVWGYDLTAMRLEDKQLFSVGKN
jgi:bis(5'-nucleosyl)-tetraphosphatase (symmetrical)